MGGVRDLSWVSLPLLDSRDVLNHLASRRENIETPNDKGNIQQTDNLPLKRRSRPYQINNTAAAVATAQLPRRPHRAQTQTGHTRPGVTGCGNPMDASVQRSAGPNPQNGPASIGNTGGQAGSETSSLCENKRASPRKKKLMNATGAPVSYQRAVYDEIREIAADFFDYDWSSLPITPRTNVLLVGSTGGGKTFLCRRLAAELGLPLLDVEYANWVVTGAGTRGGMHTLRLVYAFVQRHTRGIVVLDEVDKIGTDHETSDWTRSVHLEAFSLLDKRILPGVIEGTDPEGVPRFRMTAEEIQVRLVRGHLIVGAGAWQHLWRKAPFAGFGRSEDRTVELPTYRELVQTIRPEILNRFNGKLLFLPPLCHTDYQSLVEETLPYLPENFRPIIGEAALATIDQAVEMQKGFRWIEELVTCAIRVVRTSAPKKTLVQEISSRLSSPQAVLVDEIDTAV